MTSRSKALRAEESRSTPVAAAFDARALLATLPGLPGVYRMIGGEGEALYVGKGGDLKKRASSSFQEIQQFPPVPVILTEVAGVGDILAHPERAPTANGDNTIKTFRAA